MNAMNRREFLGSSLAAGIYSSSSDLISPFVEMPPSETESAAGLSKTPEWLSNGPLVMAGCWDDFPLFQKRLGGTPVWLDDLYREQSSDRIIKSLKDAGVTLAVIHFFKGFGLKAESEHIADAAELSHRLHQNGIRVGLYVGSTLAYETFLLEEPEAEQWLVPDYLGKPIFYADQTFRRRVYCMHPGYRSYIKRVVQYGIENLDADLIHFDNTSQQAHPSIFQHPMAIEDFRSYLASRYTARDLKSLFGLTDVRYITAPRMDAVPVRLNDPLLQTWTEFRCHQLASFYAEMGSYIRSIRSTVALDNNPSSGISGDRIVWEQGVDYPRLLAQVDAAWSEEGNAAGVTEDGVLVSKIRTLKAAAKLNRRIFCYTWGADGNWGHQRNTGSLLQMAESMAYNRQCLGMVGIFNAIPDLPAEPRNYIRFFHEHFELYRDVTSVADVALLYSLPSMGFNEDGPPANFMFAAQTLIQERLPFDIIFDRHLEDLSQYRALMLADQECLSDRQVELVRNFVSHGGGLVATGDTSLYTEHRERRRDFGLRECMGVSAPEWNGSASPETVVSGGPVETVFGRGKVVYVPQIAASYSDVMVPGRLRPQRVWPLSKNHQVLCDSMRKVLGNNCTVEIPSLTSKYVTVELVSQKDRMVLHLLNYDYKRTSQLKDLEVIVRRPADRRITRVRVLSPDAGSPEQEVSWKAVSSSPDGVTFTVPSLRIYTVIALDLG